MVRKWTAKTGQARPISSNAGGSIFFPLPAPRDFLSKTRLAVKGARHLSMREWLPNDAEVQRVQKKIKGVSLFAL